MRAYNALDTRCAELCARGHDYYADRDAVKVSAYVRNPTAAGRPDAAPAG